MFMSNSADESTTQDKMRETLTCTRLHFLLRKDTDPPPTIDVDAVSSFLLSCAPYSDGIAIAFGGAESLALELEQVIDGVKSELNGTSVYVIRVTPWGNFLPALDALLRHAVEGNYKHILFQSLEVKMSVEFGEIISSMVDDPQTLVVGAALQGHAFSAGEHDVGGLTCPWNTLGMIHKQSCHLFCMYLFFCVSIHLLYLCMYLCIYVSMHLCIYVSMHLCICVYVSMYLSVHLRMLLSTTDEVY
jgi:hypothetical protein